ncbi:MAG TPA: hypothetical protein VGG41_12995 [Solirubrobacteraceae bacterium]
MLAILLAVALAISDWPLGWRFWGHHPFIAEFAGGLALLFVAGSVFDAYRRRREAHRWHGLGFAAAGELAAILYDTAIAVSALTGSDDGYRLRSDVEFHLGPARDRATRLMGRAPIDADAIYDEPDPGGAAGMFSTLIGDAAWRRGASQTLRVSRSHLVEAVSRWATTFAVLNDDEDFNRVAHTVTIMDQITSLHMTLVAVPQAGEAVNLDPVALSSFATQWTKLRDAVDTELAFWTARRRLGSRIELAVPLLR